MPRPKRWFHVSQDINTDPEFEEICKKFGVGGVRFFLQVMAILERTENHWSLHKNFDLNVLARSCGTKPKIILGSYQLLIDMKWISVGVDGDLNQFIYARNYMKYRGNRAHEKNMDEGGSCSPPYLDLPLPALEENKNRNPPHKSDRDGQKPKSSKTAWPDNFILSPELRAYAVEAGLKDPEGEFEHFRLKCDANGYRYIDWAKAWMAWCRSPLQKRGGTTSVNGFPSKEDSLIANLKKSLEVLVDD